MRKFYLLNFLFCMLSVTMFGQAAITVKGRIFNADRQPVAGASIRILNSNQGSISDDNGNFMLVVNAAGKYEIEATAIGYAAETAVIDLSSPGSAIELTLAVDSRQLDAVVVSAEKKEATLQRVPAAVSVLGARQVQEYRLWNSKDLTAIVPNLYSANPGDARNVTSIRGITTTSYDPAVATYVDGVNQFTLDTYISQLFDVQRIEVLRGPQGTLYGRNAMGGVINIITKQPTNVTEGFAEISAGNYGQQRYGAGVRTPVVKDKLFFGAALLYDGNNGFYTNDFYHSHFDKKHSITGNYYLKYLAGSGWALTLNAKHQLNRNNGSFPLAPSADDAFANPYRVNQNAVTTLVDNVFNASLSILHSGKQMNFSSQTSYQSNYRYYQDPIDGDFSPIDGVTIINNYGKPWNNVKVYTQEFRLSSPSSVSSRLKWIAGTYFFYQDNPNKQATRFGKDAAFLGVPDSLFSTINTTKSYRTGIAGFGQITYALTPKLSFTAGLRYDFEHDKSDVLGQYQHDPDPNPQFDTRPDTSATANFSAVSPKAGLEYDFDAHLTGYITYSRGFRTGGFTQLSSDPSQPPLYAYKPEYSNNIEAGLKHTWLENRLRLNLAVFYSTVRQAQVPTLVLPDAVTITKNAGSLESYGGELEVAATPAPGFEIGYAFGYNHAVFQTLRISSNSTEADLSGKRQVFTPDLTSMLNIQYGFPLSKTKSGWPVKLVVRGEWQYLGTEYFDLANTIKQDGYSLLNAKIGIDAHAFQLSFWGRNITGKKYIAYAYDFGAVHLGDPWNYGVTLMVRLRGKG